MVALKDNDTDHLKSPAVCGDDGGECYAALITIIRDKALNFITEFREYIGNCTSVALIVRSMTSLIGNSIYMVKGLRKCSDPELSFLVKQSGNQKSELDKLLDDMQEEIKKCYKVDNAKPHIEKWVKNNLQDQGLQSTRSKIEEYMKGTFPHMTYMAVVANPPKDGLDWHKSDAVLQWFK